MQRVKEKKGSYKKEALAATHFFLNRPSCYTYMDISCKWLCCNKFIKAISLLSICALTNPGCGPQFWCSLDWNNTTANKVTKYNQIEVIKINDCMFIYTCLFHRDMAMCKPKGLFGSKVLWTLDSLKPVLVVICKSFLFHSTNLEIRKSCFQ